MVVTDGGKAGQPIGRVRWWQRRRSRQVIVAGCFLRGISFASGADDPPGVRSTRPSAARPAINLPEAKNSVGLFLPTLGRVVSETGFLSDPANAASCGLGLLEVVKLGVIAR